jgi:hypothetical protein
MNKYGLLRALVSIFAVLGFAATACSPAVIPPSPETAVGVYIHAGFEFYRWEGGLNVMIWHDGVHHTNCSTTTLGQHYEVKCQAISNHGHTYKWLIETGDGKTAKLLIDDIRYDLVNGNVFILTSFNDRTETRQLPRDLSEVQPNAESVTAFGLSDPDILEFIQISSDINNCISDCVSSTIPYSSSKLPDVKSAQQALAAFFSYLHDGEYEQAAAIYGGGYEVMRDHNPSIAPDDLAALFKNACTVNGAQCLEVRQSKLLDQPSPAAFRFSVEFINEDGSLFSRGPCCGDDNPDFVDETEFVFTVRMECTGRYIVMEMPVYLP